MAGNASVNERASSNADGTLLNSRVSALFRTLVHIRVSASWLVNATISSSALTGKK